MTSRFDHLVRRLRVRHLELLATLSDSATLRMAAQRLNLSQPAISKMLAEIEQAFGLPLFERSRRGVQPNPSGIAAMRSARIVLNELSRATDELESMRDGATALLRIGTLSVTRAVPAAIVELRRRRPGVHVRIREGRVQELVERLLDGELDCVVGAMTAAMLGSELLASLRFDALLDDRLDVLASATHPLARRRRLRWADLRDRPWVAPPRDTLVRQAFIAAFMNEGVAPPVPVIEATSSVTIGAVVRMDASLLCAVRHEQARDEVARGAVRRIAVSPAVALPPLGLFTRPGTIARAAIVDAFADALAHVASSSKAAVATS